MFTQWFTNGAGKSGATEAQALGRELETRIDAENQKRIAAMAANVTALKPGWQQRLESNAAFVMKSATIRDAIRRASTSGTLPAKAGLVFQVSSLFLRDCQKLLTGDPAGNERLHLVTGTENDGVRILSRIVDVEIDEASPAYVRAQPKALHKKVIDLVEHDGHQLFGMWHSHIMRGAETTHPSGVDLAQMQRFVDGGWDQVIGGIFNLTGHVRLFSTAHDFELKIYGSGVELVTDHPREKLLKLAMVA